MWKYCGSISYSLFYFSLVSFFFIHTFLYFFFLFFSPSHMYYFLSLWSLSSLLTFLFTFLLYQTTISSTPYSRTYQCTILYVKKFESSRGAFVPPAPLLSPLCTCMEQGCLEQRHDLLGVSTKDKGCKQEDISLKRAMFSRLGGLTSSSSFLSPFLLASSLKHCIRVSSPCTLYLSYTLLMPRSLGIAMSVLHFLYLAEPYP